MNKDLKYILILFFLGYFFLFFGNGLISLTSPDEVFYAQTAREMSQHHTWMTPILFDQPQFEKPILTYWLLRIGFIIFGVSSFSARFFPALFGLIGVIAVYLFAKLLFEDHKKAFISALVLLSAGFYIGMARTVFTDMVFSVLVLLSLLSFFWGYACEKWKGPGIILFFIFSALAVLAKGPLGLFIPFLAVGVFLLLERKIKFICSSYALWGILIFLIISLPWYILMTAKYGQAFLHEFFYNDHYRRLIEAEHGGSDRWYFYPFTMLGCMFPWSIFVAVSLFYLFWRISKPRTADLFIVSWIASTLLVFQPAHSKLTSYILPLFPALALACGDFIYDCIAHKERKRLLFILLALIWAILLFIAVGVVFASFKFSNYISSPSPVCFLTMVFILWLSVLLFYIARHKYNTAVYLLALCVPVMLSVVPFIHRDIEVNFSSQYACGYLLKNYSPDRESYVLASKDFARGTRYYTDMKVAVFAPRAKNFFSPHPIPFLDTDGKILDFLRQHPLVYCFLKKSSLENLKSALNKDFEYRILNLIGNQYIVKIQQIRHD
ncbi:MAG: glycosyltransferase family 39 protein [Candidatus Omnitrophota bacterium]